MNSISHAYNASESTGITGKCPQVSIQAGEGKRVEAALVAARYKMPLISEDDRAATRFVLVFASDRLVLTDQDNPKCRPILVPDLKMPRLSRKQLPGKAIGRQSKTVVDATAGWGSDAFLLAAMGFEVVAVERCAAVCALLEDGIERNLKINDFLHISHRYADAVSYLGMLEEKPDAVYLDPMYPQGRKKSVKVARKMSVLRTVAGEDSNFLALFGQAVRCAAKKVVLKRPKYAAVLFPQSVAMSMNGKMARYDIYHPQQFNPDEFPPP